MYKILNRFKLYNNYRDDDDDSSHDWSYDKEEEWGPKQHAPYAKYGQKQSPVHIKTEDCVDFSQHHPLRLYRDKHLPKLARCIVRNTGHGAQVDWNDAQKATIKLSNHRYELIQFHIHFPAEHVVDDEGYHEAELHLVHRNIDEEYPHDIVVLAVFFDIGEESPFLKQWFPKVPLGDDKNEMKEVYIAMRALEMEPYFYRYYGSLTTPPCSEDVKWIIMHKKETLSQEQKDFFVENFGDCTHRPTKALNDRVVTVYNKPPAV